MQLFKKLFQKQQQKPQQQQQQAQISNVNTIYNNNYQQPFSSQSKLTIPVYNYNAINRIEQFELILEQQIIDLDQLKQLTWRGAPHVYRARVWKLLLKYLPPNHMSQTVVIHKRRQDYIQYIRNYYEQINERDENEEKILKIIQNDVLRSQPGYQLFREEKIQNLLKRLLFIWSQRHPMSGYVQGINDIVSPIIVVFLNEYIQVDLEKFDLPQDFYKLPNDILLDMEADIYWCLCKIIENIQDYFIQNQPGIQIAFNQIKQIINTVDQSLIQYFNEQQIDFNHFAFRWVLCLLIREFPLYLAIRLMDTYLSEGDNIAKFHVYTVANLMLKCGQEIRNKTMGDAVLFLQNLPTKQWNEMDIELLLQEAYVLQQTVKIHQ